MSIYKCIIIDDELYAIEGLKNYINAVPNLELVKFYTDPMEALMEINAGDMVDLILLDINMPKISGLELSLEIRHKTHKLVFTTSFSQYGYEAFEREADAYLLKPYTLSKFASTIAKLFPRQVEPTPTTVSTDDDDFFFVKDKNEQLRIVKVRYQDVVAVESQQNYVFIHTLGRKVLTYMSLTEMGKTFQPFRNFVQFQRSFIINKDHIESINGNMIKMVNGIIITVGEHFKNDYQAFLSKNLIKAKRKE